MSSMYLHCFRIMPSRKSLEHPANDKHQKSPACQCQRQWWAIRHSQQICRASLRRHGGLERSLLMDWLQ